MYLKTGNVLYRNKGDQIFAAAVQDAYIGDFKHFDQNYMLSFDYVARLNRAEQQWDGVRPLHLLGRGRVARCAIGCGQKV